ncbi:hypothetical protein RCL1_004185 [Eukaryota sp. TZLM3-RCL]
MFTILDDHRCPDLNVKQQYYSIYEHRLQHFHHQLHKAASTWTLQTPSPKIIHRVLDVTSEPCIAIGTLYKDSPNRPNVLAQFELQSDIEDDDDKDKDDLATQTTDHPTTKPGSYACALEDSSGSIPLKFANQQLVHELVSGVPLAVLGSESPSGDFFIVTDVVFSGPPPPLTLTPFPSLLSSSSIVFVSDLSLCDPDSSSFSTNLLADLLSGFLSLPGLSSSRIIFTGGVFHSSETSSAGSNFYASMKAGLFGSVVIDWLNHLLSSTDDVNFDIIPGSFDPCPTSLPQPPIFKCLLPENPRLNRCRNPYSLQFQDSNNESFIISGSSGQAVNDICKYSSLSQIEALEMTLKASHFAPTAPDTLDLVPCGADPLIMKKCPRVLFSAGQNFAEKRVTNRVFFEKSCCEYETLLLNIPSFKATGTFVVLDLSTMTTKCIKISQDVAHQ